MESQPRQDLFIHHPFSLSVSPLYKGKNPIPFLQTQDSEVSRFGGMENPCFVRDEGIKLPIGYRFRPTDEELIVHYLKRKVHSVPLPAQVIPELNVFQTNPWDLPGDSKEKRHFFWKRGGSWRKCRGVTESGYWKVMGSEKHVVGFESNQTIAVKKSFIFFEGKTRTQWVMREYRLLGSQTSQSNSATSHEFVREMEEWVVYKIYQKKRKSKSTQISSRRYRIGDYVEEIRPIEMDVMIVDSSDESGPPQPSSCSSGTNDTSMFDQEETSACYISVFT